MQSPSNNSSFEREVASRFGLIPNFFVSAPDAPEIIEKLWDFAKSGYPGQSDSSTLQGAAVRSSLSRFCEVRYCILRHCGFLLGYGHSSGDPTADSQSIVQAIRLLKKEPPWNRNSDAWLSALESRSYSKDWPGSDTELEDHIFRRCHPCYSFSPVARIASDGHCGRSSAASDMSICWACWPLSAWPTIGR